jgi:fructose-1-phosphate kinase PfkB-like protein
MRWLNARGARWVLVTQGSQPVWLSSAAKAYRFTPPPVEAVVNPIACGDCLAAGIAWATRERMDIVDAVKLGIAAAGENLRDLLPARLDRERVRMRAALVKVDEVG